MRCTIDTLLITVLIAQLGGFAMIYAGIYDVAATTPHWSATHWVPEMPGVRSIKTHAPNCD
jgi:hypothetical protein